MMVSLIHVPGLNQFYFACSSIKQTCTLYWTFSVVALIVKEVITYVRRNLIFLCIAQAEI